MDDFTGRCYYCDAEMLVTYDGYGCVEQANGEGVVVCDACWIDEERGQTGITADMLREIEPYPAGVILDLGSGRFATRRSILRAYPHESEEHLTWAQSRVVVWAATMWDGIDLDGVGDDERYELLARVLSKATV